MSAKIEFERIRTLLSTQEGVAPGKMMSSEAIRYNDKVFAFFHNEMMTFKLGTRFDPADMGIDEWLPLGPFKTKPPLKGWFMIPEKHKDKWPQLAEMALLKMR